MDVDGTVSDGFAPVREAFERNFTHRGERGAAVAVHLHGRKVVDLWGGARDVDGDAASVPWERGTAQVVRSATKGVAAAVVLMLHQRGLLDLDEPVAAYWPEFKAAGKERVTVRHLLAHRAGLPAVDRPLTPAESLDPERTAAAVAAQAPAWQPGAEHGYHAQTFGWLVGELVRRVTGTSLGAWLAAEVTGPAGADLWVGLPDAVAARAGRCGPLPAPEAAGTGLKARPKRAVSEAYADPRSLTRRAFGAISPTADENDAAYRAAEMPASNGVATAEGLSRFYAALSGELDRRGPLFTPGTLELARTEHAAGPDRVLIVNTRFGAGYMLHSPASPLLAPGSFGHPGRGGALGFADPESGVAFGYVTNGFLKSVTADPRAQALVRAVRESLAAG
ncbi:serine hydrolase domain-containing protein [Streptomyces sp. NPDC002644]